MQEHKYCYLLESRIKHGWFLIDYGFDEATSLELFAQHSPVVTPTKKNLPRPEASAAVWFPSRQLALKFDSEQSIEEFQTFFARPSAIVRMELEEFLRRL
jgi:hypothetical protein